MLLVNKPASKSRRAHIRYRYRYIITSSCQTESLRKPRYEVGVVRVASANLPSVWDGLLTHFYITSGTSGTFSELARGLRMPLWTIFSPWFSHSQGTSIFYFRDDPYGDDLADLSCCLGSRRAWTSRTVWAVPSVLFASTFKAVQSFSMFDVKTPTP